MKAYYLEPITEDILVKRLSCEVGGRVLHYRRISSSRAMELYQAEDESGAKYLQHAKEIVTSVGDFIRRFLPGFPSPARADFDFIRRHGVDFLSKHELLVRVRARTSKEQKELTLNFPLPSSAFIPRILHRIQGQYLYIYSALETRILLVIGSPCDAKTDDCLIADAMEELCHVALYPYLVRRLNRNLESGRIKPSDYGVSKVLLLEGEALSKAFVLASLDRFRKGTAYSISKPEIRGEQGALVDKIMGLGIRRALKEVNKPCGSFQAGERVKTCG